MAVRDGEIQRLLKKLAQATRVGTVNRMAKLFGALSALEQGRKVLIADVDTFWLQNPLPYMQGLGVDLVGSRDTCWTDFNSGFLFYRPAATTEFLLRTSLGFSRDPQRATDNDQFLFNCAFQEALKHNITYKFTDDRLIFGMRGICNTYE